MTWAVVDVRVDYASVFTRARLNFPSGLSQGWPEKLLEVEKWTYDLAAASTRTELLEDQAREQMNETKQAL